ncbi:hypothetical protein J2Z66_005873 [Paenibacillus eucommiae]|uniref:Uncharacterized protein n=1 Tax=Paenibacillus eucommiae TaxID=1355755 RepID=A0ABS4J315_9BACL|nr:hypothetical protein [Paenibacillus eucommiae]
MLLTMKNIVKALAPLSCADSSSPAENNRLYGTIDNHNHLNYPTHRMLTGGVNALAKRKQFY